MPFNLITALFLALSLLAFPAHAAKRIALLVGNATYSDAPLMNPPNDIRQLERALSGLNFQVITLPNADQKRLQKAIREFGQEARGADVALFYYSGHGMQSRGENYLIPIGAQINYESDIPDEAVAANSVLRWLEEAAPKASVVVLDACRDNPVAGRTKSLSKGLSRMDAPSSTLIAYATAPGTTASDEGYYAKALAKYLQEPGLDLQDIFAKVGAEVSSASRGKQRPRLDVGLYEKVYLTKPNARPAAGQAVSPAEPSIAAIELAYWQGAQQTHSIEAYADYQRQYPSGRFAGQAEAAIAKLKRNSQPVAVISPAPEVNPTPVTIPSYSSTAFSGDNESIINAVRTGNVSVDRSIYIKAPDIAENGAVVPVEVSASRSFANGERLYLVVNDSFIGASLTPVDSRVQLFLSTRVKMPGTGLLKAVLVDASGQMHIAAKEVKVTIGANPSESFGKPEVGPMRMRVFNTGGAVEIKSLMNSSQNPEMYIKTVSYLVDGAKVAEVGLTPASSKNPYIGIKVSGSGGQAEMQVKSSNGQNSSALASAN